MELTKRLIDAGFTQKQAEEIIKIMRDSQAELATKADLKGKRLTIKRQDI